MIDALFTLLLPLLSGGVTEPKFEVLPKTAFRDAQYKPFRPSEPVIIKIDPNAVADAKSLIVRVFAGDPQDLRKAYFGFTAGGCYIYDSAVFTGVVDDGGFIDLGTRIDKSWLRTNNGVPADSHYLLVVERNGSPERRTLVYNGSFDEYFGRGYVFVLVAPPAPKRSAVAAEMTDTIGKALTPLAARAPSPPLPVAGVPPSPAPRITQNVDTSRTASTNHIAKRHSSKKREEVVAKLPATKKSPPVPPEHGCIVLTTR